MEKSMAPDRDRDHLRPPLNELLPTNRNNVVLPPISTITSTLKPPSAYYHLPSHTSGPPPGFFQYPTATAPIPHPRHLSSSTYAQQPTPNPNPANAELEPKPASAAQEHHKRKATSIASYSVSDSDSDSDPSPAADSEHDASSPSPSLSPSSSTPTQRLTDPSDPTNLSEPSIPDADPRLDEHRWTCGEMRAKITRFIKSGEMKVNEFQRTIDVSSKAYYDFMKMSREMRGQFSSVYDGAHRFFARREILGIRNKNKKKGVEGGDGERPAKKKAKTAMDDAKYDVSMMVSVDDRGEPMEDMPIFDTCDGVRRKIRAHLRESGWSQATFAHEISKAAFKQDSGGSVSTSAVAQFLKKSGPRAGNSSMAFYAAYVYFEKLRVKDEKPKTAFREEMEDIWPGGFDRVCSASRGYIVGPGFELSVDKYGRVRC